MTDRETFIRTFTSIYVEHYKLNMKLYNNVEYIDRPDAVIRVMAVSLAETIWDTIITCGTQAARW